MPSALTAHDISVAVAAARAAGAAALELQAFVTATSKSDGSPVTQGDLAADAVIRHHLTLNFPHDALLSEESPDDGARLAQRRLWIIDPIDGTSDYLKGSGEWAVQLALAVDGELVLGVLDLPAEGICLVGAPGSGAWRLDNDGEHALSIRAGGEDILITSQSRRNRAAVERIHQALPELRVISAHSVGVKAWRILDGSAGLYVHPRSIAEWDAAAPAAVLLAAGASATDLAGERLRFNSHSGRCPGLVFSKRSDHAALVERMRTAGVELSA
jgi:3'-phosphoadenosine 5'-phosphosulfate (PAPS) 3'-phosphatase